MNLIYFTTAQETTDFDKFRELWTTPINPSNQIFHNKLIRALSFSHHVDVISLRPFSSERTGLKKLQKEDKITSQIHWHYLKVVNPKFDRFNIFLMQARKIVKSCPKNSIIITDTINPSCLAIANACSKSFKLPVIGVCTDSPSNITGTTRAYTKTLLKISKNLSGYICLTTGLNELFNEHNAPCVVIEGLVESTSPEKRVKKYGQYFFMGGALSERYGVYDLINAFNKFETKKKLNLIICGHFADENKLNKAVDSNRHIYYLGSLSNEEVLMLEANAYACVNPRPFNEDLDRYSIPSKVLEYLNSGSPTICVKNSKLYKIFSDDVIWAKSSSEDDLIEAFKKLESFSDSERKALVAKAMNDVYHYFSLEAINEKLNGFLYLFNKK